MTNHTFPKTNENGNKVCPNFDGGEMILIKTEIFFDIKIDIYKCPKCGVIQLFESKN